MAYWISGSLPADGPWYVSPQGAPLEPPQQFHRKGKLRFRSVPNWLPEVGGQTVQPLALSAFLRW